LSWEQVVDLDDTALEQRLFVREERVRPEASPPPDWASVHQELKRKGVTLYLLWEEYKVAQPDGYQYSWFCHQYRRWVGKLDVVFRQTYRAGEQLFVDYAGQTVAVRNPKDGTLRAAQIFVAVLGASSYTYVEATWSQGLSDWIGSHVRAFTFFGGVPEILVPDNLKSGVTKSDRYEPTLNRTYQELAAHYGVAVVPARAGKPRDKAKVESGVLVVERQILARLRHQTFYSLHDLNAMIAPLREQLNARPFQKLPGSRQQLFDTLERAALKPLPVTPYEYAEWKTARVNIDYHIAVDGHYYSVPYQLVKQQVDVRLTARIVECFAKGQRVSSHRRSGLKGRHTTVPEHMPKAHQRYLEWTPERLVRWAEQTGPATAQVIAHILASRPHPQQGFRSCLGIMRLGKTYSPARLEAACQRALALEAYAYRSIASILKHGLDQRPLPPERISPPLPQHPNIRGPEYYD
jgi:transposase